MVKVFLLPVLCLVALLRSLYQNPPGADRQFDGMKHIPSECLHNAGWCDIAHIQPPRAHRSGVVGIFRMIERGCLPNGFLVTTATILAQPVLDGCHLFRDNLKHSDGATRNGLPAT